MIFWNDLKLANKLKNNEVSDKEKFYYFFGGNFLLALGIYLIEYIGDQNFSFIDKLIQLAIFIVGTIICYRTNSKGDNQSFIERYTCLYFPIIIRTTIIAIGIFISLFILISIIYVGYIRYIASEINLQTIQQAFNFWLSALNSNTSSMLFDDAFLIYFYYRMNKSIKLVSST